MKIIMFTDFVCEWCYLGKRILDTLKHRYEFEVEYKFMEIHPDTPPEGMPFTYHLHFPNRFFDMINKLGEPYGIHIANKDIFANTNKALLLAEYAKDIGKLDTYMNLIWDKYMVEGINISREDILQNIVMNIGINPRNVSKALSNPRYSEELENSSLLYKRFECNGVPTFIVNCEYRLTGAQSAEKWIELFEKIQKQ